MIGYATLGTNDIDKALAFYDALLATAGGKRLMQMPDERKLTFYGNGPGKPMLAIVRRQRDHRRARADRRRWASMARISAIRTATSSACSRWADR